MTDAKAPAIVAQFLNKRKRSNRENAAVTPPPATKPALQQSEPAVVAAANKIQRVFRGHLLRQQLKRLAFQSRLSGNSLHLAVDLITKWYYGWINQLVVMFLLLFFLITVYFQALSTRPSAYDTDSAVMARMDLLQDARARVSNSARGYDFMRAMIEEVSHVDSPPNKRCRDLLSILCPVNLAKFRELYGTNETKFTSDILNTCEDISRYSGYVDNSNRVVGTIYVTQTRSSTRPCTDKMRGIDPYKGNVRQCLTDSLDTTYLPRVPRTCTTCNAFEYQNGSFVFALTGDAFNLPTEFMQCRIDGLEQDGWLDFRTRDLCFLMTMLNTNDDGRIVAYSECFRFGDGGKVSNVRDLASVSFLANGDQGLLALTLASIVLITLRQLWVVYQLARTPRYYLSPSFLFRLVGPGLELAANAMFVEYLDFMGNFAFREAMTKEMFYTNTFAFLTEFQFTFAMADRWKQYTLIASLGLLFRLADVILSVEFHPSSALVSGILRHASARLVSFLFVFALFVLVYAFIGLLLFSRTTEQFSDFGRALNTLLLIWIGEVQDMSVAIFNASNPHQVRAVQVVYFWAYVFIVTILLMSVLLAIIVGAYVELSDTSRLGEPMLSFLTTLLESVGFGARAAWIRTKRACRRVLPPPSPPPAMDDLTERQQQQESLAPGEQTPLELLLHIKHEYRVSGCAATELRPFLRRVFLFEQSVERVLTRCRAQTRLEQLQPDEMFLRGLEANSPALTAHGLGLLESIHRRVKQE